MSHMKIIMEIPTSCWKWENNAILSKVKSWHINQKLNRRVNFHQEEEGRLKSFDAKGGEVKKKRYYYRSVAYKEASFQRIKMRWKALWWITINQCKTHNEQKITRWMDINKDIPSLKGRGVGGLTPLNCAIKHWCVPLQMTGDTLMGGSGERISVQGQFKWNSILLRSKLYI